MKGVCRYLGITYKVPKKENNTNNNTSKETTYYRILTNSYLYRNYAEKEVAELKKLGISAFLDAFKKIIKHI